jgi:hypothetical protein
LNIFGVFACCVLGTCFDLEWKRTGFDPQPAQMGSAGGGLVEGQALPTAFALFLVQVLIIISIAKFVTLALKPVSTEALQVLRSCKRSTQVKGGNGLIYQHASYA